MPTSIRFTYSATMALTFLSLMAHLATFTSLAVNETFFAYSLGLLLMLLVMLLVVYPTIIWLWRRLPKGNLVSEVFGSIPRWLKIAVVGLLVYLVLNYLICRSLNDGGVPVVLKDGRRVLQSGNDILRVLSREQYAWAEARQIRMITGHFVVFYGLALLAVHAIWLKTGTAMASKRVKGP